MFVCCGLLLLLLPVCVSGLFVCCSNGPVAPSPCRCQLFVCLLLLSCVGWPDAGCWHGDKEYPDTWCDFGCARQQLDPNGVFADSAPDRCGSGRNVKSIIFYRVQGDTWSCFGSIGYAVVLASSLAPTACSPAAHPTGARQCIVQRPVHIRSQGAYT